MNHGMSGWKIGAIVLGLVMLVSLVIGFNGRMAELRRLTAEQVTVEAKKADNRSTQVALLTQIAYATSESAVKDWAYADGHMRRPGDVPVVPVEPTGAIATRTPQPVPVVAEKDNWEKWWDLFFGEVAP